MTDTNEFLVSSEIEITERKPNRADGAVWSDVWQGYCWFDEDGVMHVDKDAS